MAPPITVAYFSNTLNPGVVFLVFFNLVLVEFIAKINLCVSVEMLERCCKKFKTVRSVARITFELPDMLKILEFFFNFAPSL